MGSSAKTNLNSFYQNGADESLLPQKLRCSNKLTDVKVYGRRWYILILYCCVAMMQNLMWNTWSPIEATARAVYGWENYVIDLISLWGSLFFCVTTAPFAWLMDVKGLRTSILLAAGLQVLGGGVRCIPTDSRTVSTGLIHTGQIIIALAGPVGMAAPALLSSTWFPKDQRTTATAITSMAGYIGTALSFIVGPQLFVDDVRGSNAQKSGDNYVLNSTAKAEYRGQINRLLYVQGAAMVAVFLAILFYYPAKPPKPPSPSAASGRVDFKDGLRKLLQNYNFHLAVFVYGACTGVYGGWMAVLAQNLSEFGLRVGQDFSGWLGFVAIVSGAFSGILISLFTDHFSGHLKLLLIVFLALSFYTVLAICYVFTKVIAFDTILVYVLFALSGFFVNGTIPFFFELAVEISYPVAEGVTTSVMTFSNNFLQSVFLVVPLAHLGTRWMIWATVATCAVSTVLMLFVKETYNRSYVDEDASHVHSVVPSSVVHS